MSKATSQTFFLNVSERVNPSELISLLSLLSHAPILYVLIMLTNGSLLVVGVVVRVVRGMHTYSFGESYRRSSTSIPLIPCNGEHSRS